MTRTTAKALAGAVALAAVACGCLEGGAEAERAAKAQAELERTRAELAATRKDVARLRAEFAEASARMAALPAPGRARPRAGTGIDEARLREFVREAVRLAVREELVETGALLGGLKGRVPPALMPRAVSDAAAGLMAGLRITRAERKTSNDRAYFKLRGRLGGEEYDLEVWADGEIREAELPPEFVPEAVREAAAKAIPGMELRDAKRDTDNGMVIYELEGRFGGEKYDLKLTADGDILEAELPPDQAPELVRAAATKAVEGIELTEVKQDIDDGRVLFEVEGRAGGEKCQLKISPDGEVLEAEMPASAAPEVVRNAAARSVDGIDLRDVDRWIDDDDGDLYEFKGRLDGEQYEIKVTPAGEVLEVDVPIEHVPQVVKDAALKAVPGIELDDEAERKIRNGIVVYDVRGEVDGDDCEIRVSADGTVLEIDGAGGADAGGDGEAEAPGLPPVVAPAGADADVAF